MKKPFRIKLKYIAVIAIVFSVSMGLPKSGIASGDLPLIIKYAEQLKNQTVEFTGFSAKRGRLLFSSNNTTGKPETPSCTSCHTKSPLKAGQTRAGKEISPMAISRSPDRYTDPKKVEKWFRRNCKSVLGRVCTQLEKGDFLTFMLTQ